MKSHRANFSLHRTEVGRFFLQYATSSGEVILISQSFMNRSAMEQYLAYVRQVAMLASDIGFKEDKVSNPRFRQYTENMLWYFDMLDMAGDPLVTSIAFSSQALCRCALEDFRTHVLIAPILDYTA